MIIECKNLTHYYGDSKIYEDLNFGVKKGNIVGLLGKNGVGKSTTINILMGFLTPMSGECLIFGSPSYDLTNEQKERIGLLYEGHTCYDFFTIEKIEKFYAKQYPKRWKKDLYYELVDKLGVSYNQKIISLSCGQRSQVVLGLIFAQDPDLLILDDYSMGLDVGYRKLFVEYLSEFAKNKDKTVLMTTHIVSDLEHLLDELVIMKKNSPILSISVDDFMKNFKKYRLDNQANISTNNIITNVETIAKRQYIYTFEQEQTLQKELTKQGANVQLEKVEMNFEDAFLGYTGRY